MNDELHRYNQVKGRKAVAIKGSNADTAQHKITAKGRDCLAERILDIAFEKDIKVRQDKALTDILDAYDIESPVPLEALKSVSLILEYVYKANLAVKENSDFYKNEKSVSIETSNKPDIVDI